MTRIVVIMLILAGIALADPQNIPLSVAAGGAAHGASEIGHSLRGTLGQAVAQRAQNTSGTLSSGFWPSRRSAVPLDIPETTIELPHEYSFAAAYPNPFNPSTTLSFSLPLAAHVELFLFDVTGRKVGTLASGKYTAGSHIINWNAAHVASGTYFARLRSGAYSATQKLQLIK